VKGKELWRKTVSIDEKMPTHKTNPYAGTIGVKANQAAPCSVSIFRTGDKNMILHDDRAQPVLHLSVPAGHAHLISEQDKHQITSIAKTIKQIEDNVKELDKKLTLEEKTRIQETISNVKRRLKHGANDLKRTPQRFDYMDFSESIRDVSHTLPLIA